MERGFITIPKWMLSLDLDIYETIIFAVIFGFSQDGDSRFSGSQAYLATWAKCSRRKVTMVLPKLVEMGLIQKVDKEVRGMHLCEYRVSPTFTGCASHAQGCASHAHNNIVDSSSNIVIDKSITHTTIGKAKEHFSFFDALMEIGVTKEVANAWLQVRKAKRAVNTEVAFNRIKQEISKTGLPANECITIAVANSWQGFQASWVANRRSTPPQTPPHKESVFEHNLRVVDEMFGTNLHEQNYGNKKADIDEQ